MLLHGDKNKQGKEKFKSKHTIQGKNIQRKDIKIQRKDITINEIGTRYYKKQEQRIKTLLKTTQQKFRNSIQELKDKISSALPRKKSKEIKMENKTKDNQKNKFNI